MQTVDVLIGLPGAGKSRYVDRILLPKRGEEHTVRINPDQMRKQLLGDESDQSRNQKVFGQCFHALGQTVRNGQNVIWDATAMSVKERRIILSHLPKHADLVTQAHVILASPEQCIRNQDLQERKVPQDVIYRMMRRFQSPEMWEGWTEPPVYFYDREAFAIPPKEELMERLHTVGQIGKYHTENAWQHTRWMLDECRKEGLPEWIREAAYWHDIGKADCRTEDKDGNAHFYGHANISTWRYLCDAAANGELTDAQRKTAALISHHSDGYAGKDRSKELEETYGAEFMAAFQTLRELDGRCRISREQMQDMPLLEVLNTFDRVDEILRHAPFELKITTEGACTLYKYSQFATDMSYRCCREARGSIFETDAQGNYRYVCRPFDKFFNVGEPHADKIDWDSAVVTEKIDGSLIKAWHDGKQWRLSTNGMIDAFAKQVEGCDLTWGEIFERAAGCGVETLMEGQNKEETYLFELTSPETRVVISYPDGITYLSRRNTETGQELHDVPHFRHGNVKTLSNIDLHTLKDVTEVVQVFPKDREGVVVRDGESKRIKVKSPAYLEAAHLRQNKVTERQILSMYQADTLDDLLAYYPQHKEKAEQVLEKVRRLTNVCEQAWEQVQEERNRSRAEFAQSAKQTEEPAYAFYKLDHPEGTPHDYLKQLSLASLHRKIQQADKEADK